MQHVKTERKLLRVTILVLDVVALNSFAFACSPSLVTSFRPSFFLLSLSLSLSLSLFTDVIPWRMVSARWFLVAAISYLAFCLLATRAALTLHFIPTVFMVRVCCLVWRRCVTLWFSTRILISFSRLSSLVFFFFFSLVFPLFFSLSFLCFLLSSFFFFLSFVAHLDLVCI